MDNKAQMMVLEAVVFSISIIISLAFLFQISPSSALTDQYTKELKIQGDDALMTLYFQNYESNPSPTNYPTSKLINYIINEDYSGLTSDLNEVLLNTEYNIRISNKTKTIFWCNSNGKIDELENRRAISASHCIVAIDPYFFNAGSRLENEFPHSNTFKVILEVWSLK
jgi:hypothetical protein